MQREINLFFCGDIKVQREDREVLVSDSLKKKIEECDLICCNLEGPMINDNASKIKKIGPNTFQSGKTISKLKDVGFNIAFLANNHIMDYGKEGLKQTCNGLNTSGINYTGAGFSKEDAFRPIYYNFNGCTIGLIALAENGFGAFVYNSGCGYAWFGEENIEHYIKKVKEKCDFLIINIHAGAEEFEYPLPEIRELYRNLILLGADVVVGHHPHVVQGYEKYGQGVIFYSLGNFAFDKTDNHLIPYNPDGVGVIVRMDIITKTISHNFIFTEYENGIVDLANQEKTEQMKKHMIDMQNVLLSDKEYLRIVNDFCLKAYENNYKVYYSEGVVGKYKGFKGFLKFLRRHLIRHTGFDDDFLYHNLAIETHYWIAKRASFLNLKSNWW